MKSINCPKWYADWKLWLLFFIINLSGNPAFSMFLPYHLVVILLFLFLSAYIVVFRVKTVSKVFGVLLLWVLIMFIQVFYIPQYSISSNFHVILKAGIGLFSICIIGEKFIRYYSNILYFLCIVSLIGFIYNAFGGVWPYIPITGMDNDKSFRVTSILYTQLYNLNAMGITLRNCGPFWEPGAFQGFINMALLFEVLYNHDRDKRWWLRIIVFIVTIITTYSTGGYIVLFFIVSYFILDERSISKELKLFLILTFSILAVYIFFSTEFLYDKVSNDEGRVGVSFSEFFTDNIWSTLFGFSFSAESFEQSSIVTASSVFNLVRYTGWAGLFLYFAPCIGQPVHQRLFYLFILLLIMMNEPFITAGVLWWGIPFVCHCPWNHFCKDL